MIELPTRKDSCYKLMSGRTIRTDKASKGPEFGLQAPEDVKVGMWTRKESSHWLCPGDIPRMLTTYSAYPIEHFMQGRIRSPLFVEVFVT